MKIWRGDPLAWGPGPDGGTALTIGVFDGVHRGHRTLLDALSERAVRAGGLETVVVTFDVHPRRFFDPIDGPAMLVTLSRRLELLESMGVDHVGVLPFADVRHLGPEDFIRRVVSGGFNARAVVVGEGFRYGARRAGDMDDLVASGHTHGFRVDAIRLRDGKEGPVSSSTIRRHIAVGEVADAAELLGRHHEVPGRLVAPEGLGDASSLAVDVDWSMAVPGSGVYAVNVGADDPANPGACAIGGAGRPLRVRLPDGSTGPIPGDRLVLTFLDRLRPAPPGGDAPPRISPEHVA
ncbi:MAG: adenylyltransferase/cytidyltransferase family protein [bacterium]|nr:adenylyltransferase/cytidyltransferase family protein [bacterium]MDE0351955.1 adenylyltransferase/cytidyltransferase family protein [bacterium]